VNGSPSERCVVVASKLAMILFAKFSQRLEHDRAALFRVYKPVGTAHVSANPPLKDKIENLTTLYLETYEKC